MVMYRATVHVGVMVPDASRSGICDRVCGINRRAAFVAAVGVSDPASADHDIKTRDGTNRSHAAMRFIDRG